MRVPGHLAVLVIASGVAFATPHAPDPASARLAYVAARAECKRPARRLAGLVAERFSPSGFGGAVADDWNRRSDDERRALEVLADRVVGGPIRTTAIAELCAGSEIESVRVHGEGVWVTVVRRDDHDACDPERHHLVFQANGSGWLYDGAWSCAATGSRRQAWRRHYGTDYDHAMAILACEDQGVTPCETTSNWKSEVDFEPEP